jgi:hypothetical protein
MKRYIIRSLMVAALISLVVIAAGTPTAQAEDFDTWEFSATQAVPLSSSTGVAQITGTIHCSDYGSGDMWGELRQNAGRKSIIKAYIYTGLECHSKPTQWSVSVVADNSKFVPGKATVLATVCMYGTIQRDVCRDLRAAVRIKKSKD